VSHSQINLFFKKFYSHSIKQQSNQCEGQQDIFLIKGITGLFWLGFSAF